MSLFSENCRSHKLRSHGAVKKHKCPHDGCDYAAPTKSWLLKHIAQKHDKTKWKCHLCKYITFLEHRFQKHMSDMHDNGTNLHVSTEPPGVRSYGGSPPATVANPVMAKAELYLPTVSICASDVSIQPPFSPIMNRDDPTLATMSMNQGPRNINSLFSSKPCDAIGQGQHESRSTMLMMSVESSAPFCLTSNSDMMTSQLSTESLSSQDDFLLLNNYYGAKV